MNNFLKKIGAIESYLGGLKFAVTLIVAFSIVMIVGTFVESLQGTDFANRLIYKHPLFMGLLFFFFLTIFLAMLLRFPYKKRLAGFYIVHTGLITILAGSFITFVAGIDGQIILNPLSPNQNVELSQDQLKLTNLKTGEWSRLNLPYNAFTTNLNVNFGKIKAETFYPFAKKVLRWVPISQSNLEDGIHASSYSLDNGKMTQSFVLGLHEWNKEIRNDLSLGPLTVIYLSSKLAPCFKNSESYFFWDAENKVCLWPKKGQVISKKTSSGQQIFLLKHKGDLFSYFPSMSPFPFDKNLKLHPKPHIRIFYKDTFLGRPYLFLFGPTAIFHNKNTKKWEYAKLDIGHPVSLPWMGFKLTLLRHEEKKYPIYRPEYQIPKHAGGKLVEGGLRAVKLVYNQQEFWANNNRPIIIATKEGKFRAEIVKESFSLPFKITLSQFKMKKIPGTERPASFESFVTLHDQASMSNHHIFMNNPLKKDPFTFYQASYFPVHGGQFGSILSVNYDPGRFAKYLGSLLLVLGSILHFYLKQKKKAR